MSDEDLQAMTYAELWLSELGGTAPEHPDRDRSQCRNELGVPRPRTAPEDRPRRA